MIIVSENLRSKIVFFTILIIFSTVLKPFVFEGGKNALLIGVLYTVPILLLAKYKSTFRFEVFFWIFALFFFLSGYYNIKYFRASTIIYTYLFLITFIYYLRIIYKGQVTLLQYKQVVRFLIISYGIVLILQQVSVIVGLPVINQIIPYDEFKLNSLSLEPSHSARILTMLLYSHIITEEIKLGNHYRFINDIRNNKYIYLFYTYAMLSMGSASAYIFLPLLFTRFLRAKDLVLVLVIFSLLTFSLSKVDNPVIDRAVNFSKAIFTLDEEIIREADHSGSVRIIPSILALQMVNIFDTKTWFGHGIDYLSSIVPDHLPGIMKNQGGGGILAYILTDFGLLVFIVFWVVFAKVIFRGLFSFDTLLWLVLMSSVSLNNQITWLVFMLLATNKYFYKRSILYPNKNVVTTCNKS